MIVGGFCITAITLGFAIAGGWIGLMLHKLGQPIWACVLVGAVIAYVGLKIESREGFL